MNFWGNDSDRTFHHILVLVFIKQKQKIHNFLYSTVLFKKNEKINDSIVLFLFC